MGAADLIRLAEEIVAHELDAAAHDAPADAARRLFETDAPSRPEAAGATAHPAWRAAGAIMVRAELLRQFPGLMQVAPEAFAAWAVNVAEARFALHAAIAGHMAQRCYDLARGVGVDRCPALHWLDRLVDALLARAGDALVAATSPTGRSSEPGLPWPQEEDDAVVAAFDALGEMETLAPERDRRAQAAGDTVRLLLGRVTADAIWRLTQRALQGDGAVQSALQCAPIAGPLHGLATLVMSDGRSWDIATARTAAARLLGRNAPDADAALRLRSLSSDDPHRTRHRP